ncbi:hypothetical protein B0A48_12959 [Cryoendolithus antarcticus]|uniref:Protein YOP1 n=1 Tax=Cryoendolithus antarcticus TaxID=1507870 RepID=A0A1V8SQU5_9PEZI|nr:hypothetical protein B0A48_12959 [Cryoendolithus antarcticus]OQO24979.1 hypothetical protein B0A51_05754 [Rachicladosporium sp. CCFEE 5018]OQO26320.1 hypothetical protein B0A51_05171 [Rachicladosporium sp. CCFEE 5018]OQO26810.1 hypothetical protein B0A51_04393 [Rachicladosporium sp. CCFEE 5018]
MFGFIADILTSVTSILFPVFASYKALRTGDPAQLTPWLMYWTTLSLFLLVESQLYFILYWIPFYAWMRLGMHLYLVLPGKQGSVFLYREYIHPFLEQHERTIDQTISSSHAKAKAAGLDAVKRAIEYVRVQFLGQAPSAPTPPTSRNVSYSSALLNRFAMPAARSTASAGYAAPAAALTDLLGNLMSQSTSPTSTSRDARAQDLVRSDTLIPSNLSGTERSDYVRTQRDHLQTLLRAFDQEDGGPLPSPNSTQPPSYTSSLPSPSQRPSSRKPYLSTEDNMHKSRSESEFEDLAYESMPDPEQFRPSPQVGGRESSGRKRESGGAAQGQSQAGWSKYIWGDYGERDSAVGRDGRRKGE